jgi:hypothetical protein
MMTENTVVRWAIMVPFGEEWLYVVDVNTGVDVDSLDRYQPLLYDTQEAAEAVAELWKTYRIVEYAC